MQKNILTGRDYLEIVMGGAENLDANVDIVNDLNVFPIPDGDTGVNMKTTLFGGLRYVENPDETDISRVAALLAKGMLFSACGNSGVILSQYFAGIAKGLSGKKTATVLDMAQALHEGVKSAYSAVVNPTEGTILTVVREATDYACNKITQDSTFITLITDFLQKLEESLKHTPDLLPVLKEAGVVDSGGAGFYYFVEGVYRLATGETITDTSYIRKKSEKKEENINFDENSEMTFGYCTELLLQLQNKNDSTQSFQLDSLIDYLKSIGDSIVAVQTDSIVKVHVHTMTPEKVLNHCHQFGEFIKIKVENMTLQHNESLVDNRFETKSATRVAPRKKYGLVTVATGEGLIETFKGFGADVVINGGQTNNPSTEEFIKAFEKTNADTIFVLPNNSNIILAAQQAAQLYEGSTVFVVESKSIGEGYAAIAMLDFSADSPEEIVETMKTEMSTTTTGAVTKSIRDTTCGGIKIANNDYIGFVGKEMIAAHPQRLTTVCELISKINDQDKQLLILIYGASVEESEKESIRDFVSKTQENLELYEIEGKQDIYDYYIIIQ